MSASTLIAEQFVPFGLPILDPVSIFSEQEFFTHQERPHLAPQVSDSEAAFNTEIEFVLTNDASVRSATDEQSKNQILAAIHSKLQAIQGLGDDWNEEGVKGPNSRSIEVSADLALQFVENDFAPSIVTQSAEEGVSFVFKDGLRFLYLEVYNDGDMGLIAEDYKNRKIISNKPVKTKSEIIREISNFFGK